MADWMFCKINGTQPAIIGPAGGRISYLDDDVTETKGKLLAAAPTFYKLLDEAIDLVPRISDDDPMAPALADWVRKVRAAMSEVK